MSREIEVLWNFLQITKRFANISIRNCYKFLENYLIFVDSRIFQNFLVVAEYSAETSSYHYREHNKEFLNRFRIRQIWNILLKCLEISTSFSWIIEHSRKIKNIFDNLKSFKTIVENYRRIYNNLYHSLYLSSTVLLLVLLYV